MSDRSGFSERLKRRLAGFSICGRIAIGNAAIIVIGATAETFLARRYSQSSLLILVSIVALSIAGSYAITRLALKPLSELRIYLEQARGDFLNIAQPFQSSNPDFETCMVADALASLISQLESANRQLKAVCGRAITAQEEERKRIARWLHDDTSQSLAILILQLERFERRLPGQETEMRAELQSTRELAGRTLNELRKIIHGLRPSILDDLGLAPAIRWYARSTLEEAGIQVNVDVDKGPAELPPELAITLFRIAQEAINNISHHSQAHSAGITLRGGESEIYLAVEDDGAGFRVDDDLEEAIRKRHWGIIGIKERLDRIGGWLNLVSEPGKGTLLEVYVPRPRGQMEVFDEQENSHPVGR